MKTDTIGMIYNNRMIFGKILSLIFILLLSAQAFAQSWSALAGGINGYVYATAIYNGDLIVAGQFSSADGVEAKNIARWDGSSWSGLGNGLNGSVTALTVYNGQLVAGGNFTIAGDLDVNFIAAWDGVAWSDHLGGVGNTIAALTVYGNDLVAGGSFLHADGIPANYIAKFNDANGWSTLGSGMGGTQGKVMALTVHGGVLVAGGLFTTAGGTPANHIAQWDGTSWSSYGNGIGGAVYSLSGYHDSLVAGGLFSTAGNDPANNIALWDGNSWNPLGSGTAGTLYQFVLSLAVYQGNLYAGGLFTIAGGNTVNGIARWDGSAWSDLNGGVWNSGLNAFGVYSMLDYGNDLIVGGIFNTAGSVPDVENVAAWNEPLIPLTLTIRDDTVVSESTNCYNAIQTIAAAGEGSTFVVQNGGSATLIAGQNIIFLPGTKVNSGGYLLGHITTTNQFCGTLATPTFPLPTGIDMNPTKSMTTATTVYPNPSDGTFFLALNQYREQGNARAEVFNARGEIVLKMVLKDGSKDQFSLRGMPSGVYFIRLVHESKVEIIKILKQ